MPLEIVRYNIVLEAKSASVENILLICAIVVVVLKYYCSAQFVLCKILAFVCYVFHMLKHFELFLA